MEEGKNLECTLEELHGVWGAECHHSGYRNKRDLRGSVAHNYRELSYKPQGEMRATPLEKSEEVIYPWRVETT
jgi:hypothetical protein